MKIWEVVGQTKKQKKAQQLTREKAMLRIMNLSNETIKDSYDYIMNQLSLIKNPNKNKNVHDNLEDKEILKNMIVSLHHEITILLGQDFIMHVNTVAQAVQWVIKQLPDRGNDNIEVDQVIIDEVGSFTDDDGCPMDTKRLATYDPHFDEWDFTEY